jgi:hypothetical protein
MVLLHDAKGIALAISYLIAGDRGHGIWVGLC